MLTLITSFHKSMGVLIACGICSVCVNIAIGHNRSKQASMKETVPDLAKTNKQRAVKAVKKNLQFTGEKIASVVKRAVTGKKK